jgi:hypothetical protein
VSKNQSVFIMHVVLKSKNDCAKKSEVTLNGMLQITAKRFGPLAVVHPQLVIQVNGIFKG